jgi:hypothetical protein
MIVSTERAHGEELVSATREEDVFSSELSGDHTAVREFVDWESVFEIGFGSVSHAF